MPNIVCHITARAAWYGPMCRVLVFGPMDRKKTEIASLVGTTDAHRPYFLTMFNQEGPNIASRKLPLELRLHSAQFLLRPPNSYHPQ
jgi:hypothetical protein